MTSNDLEEMGPVDYLVIEFPGSHQTGEGLPLLVDLVDRGLIRILDLVVVRKETDGSVIGAAIADFDGDGTLDLAVFEGAPSGILDEEDIEEAGSVLAPGSVRRGARLRERVGGALRPRRPAWRGPARRQRPHPRAGAARRRRRRRIQARLRGP